MSEKATIQDVVDAIDRQTAVIERALEPRRLNIPEGERDGKMPTRLLWASLPDVQPSEASQGTQPTTDAPGPAQTLADLTPCLGDRVRVEYLGSCIAVYGWRASRRDFGWLETGDLAGYISKPDAWTVLEPLDPVTPEEPPVGSGMLVDRDGVLWRRDKDGWRFNDVAWSKHPHAWGQVLDVYLPLRPVTPADLARHGVGEDGKPVGKGEADEDAVTVKRIHLEVAQEWYDDGALETAADIDAYRAIRDALKAGER